MRQVWCECQPLMEELNTSGKLCLCACLHDELAVRCLKYLACLSVNNTTVLSRF